MYPSDFPTLAKNTMIHRKLLFFVTEYLNTVNADLTGIGNCEKTPGVIEVQ